MPSHRVVLEEDFANLPVGVIAGDYSPVGEYHVGPALADSGRWRETFLHHSFGRISRGNWQVVIENSGAHVLEQTASLQPRIALLATGEPRWRDAQVTVALRPLCLDGRRGFAFRYQHARRYYAILIQQGMAQVVRQINADETLLAEAPFVLDPDVYQQVLVACEGSSISLSVNGAEVLTARDDSPEAFDTGCVALIADHLTRYASVCVVADAPPTAPHVQTASLTAAAPRALLWRKIATPGFGSDRNLRFGDIDGVGRPEIVIARHTERLGGDNFSSIASLAAYNLDGKRLWTLGQPPASSPHTTCDLCYQLHDIDGDGRAELIYARDWDFIIADGATGKNRRSMALPHRLDRASDKPYRIFADSIYFCDLAGSGRPNSILVKDRYSHLYAYDGRLSHLWSYAANIGHFPHTADIDNDGRDEIAIGYSLLGPDGVERWRKPYEDHADNVALVKFGGQWRCVIAGSDAGFILLDIEGRQLARYPIGHAQSMYIGRLIPDSQSLQIVCNTYWGAAGITAVFDESGRVLNQFEPMPYACLLQPVNWRAGADLILLSTHPRQGGLIDADGRRAVMFPDDGHPVLCSDARDIDGDGIDEVLTWNEHEIWIYKADVPGRTPANYPRRNPWYNDSNYRAQLSLPTGR